MVRVGEHISHHEARLLQQSINSIATTELLDSSNDRLQSQAQYLCYANA